MGAVYAICGEYENPNRKGMGSFDIAELYRKTEKPLLRTLLSSSPA